MSLKKCVCGGKFVKSRVPIRGFDVKDANEMLAAKALGTRKAVAGEKIASKY